MFTQVVQVGYPDGRSHKVLADLSNYRTISLSADGESFVAVQRQTISNVWLTAHNAPERATQITAGAGRYFDIKWTPDGKIIYASDASGSAEIWEMESNGADQHPVTNSTGRNYAPTVTPDGRSILFHSNRSGTWQVWKMDRDGSNPRQLSEGTDNSNWPVVSPDGRWVVYDRVGEGSLAALWKMPIDGGTPIRLTSQLATRASISPDGRLIAYWQKDQQPNAVWRIAIINFDGGTPIKTFDVPQSPANSFTPLRWTQDGRALSYIDYRDGAGTIWVQPLDGSAPQQFLTIPNNQLFAFDVSPDGNFIFSRGPTTYDIILVKNGG
jgi:Tol biopolymer transport system component